MLLSWCAISWNLKKNLVKVLLCGNIFFLRMFVFFEKKTLLQEVWNFCFETKKNKLLLGKKIVFTPIKDISLISCSLVWVWLFGFINWVDNLTWLLLKLLSVRKKIKHLSLFISIFIKDMISVLSLNYFPDDAFLISQSNNELYQYKHITAQT